MRLWIEPPERPDQPDTAHHDAWRMIVDKRAVPAAVDAGLALVREGKLLRPSAFIDLVEAVDASVLEELAGIVVRTKWPRHPYLAVVFSRMIELKQEKQLTAFLERAGVELVDDPDGWALGAFVLTTSRVGNREFIAGWFEGAEHRPGVPMWAFAARAATIFQEAQTPAKLLRTRFDRVVELARVACKTAIWDDTAAFCVCLLLIDHLRNQRFDEFRATLQEHRALLQRYVTAPAVEHPIVRYANSVKRAQPVTAKHLEFRRYRGHPAALATVPGALVSLPGYLKEARERPIHLQLVELVGELDDFTTAALQVLLPFDEMLESEPRSPRARELAIAMRKSKPASIPWVRPAWAKLVKSRVPWQTRVRLAIGA